MFEDFEQYITSQITLSAEDMQLIRSLATVKELRKRQQLLHEGEVCRCKSFVVKGLLRTYRTGDDGAEYIMRFAAENGWAVDPESYNNQKPSKYNMEAMEDTELISWTKENFDQIIASIPQIKAYSEQLIYNNIDATQNRLLMTISSKPEERYHAFIKSFPHIYPRVPLHMIASYLGVSRETLTRVRRMHSMAGKR